MHMIAVDVIPVGHAITTSYLALVSPAVIVKRRNAIFGISNVSGAIVVIR